MSSRISYLLSTHGIDKLICSLCEISVASSAIKEYHRVLLISAKTYLSTVLPVIAMSSFTIQGRYTPSSVARLVAVSNYLLVVTTADINYH